MNHAMEVEASLHPEVNLTIYNGDLAKQISDVEKFISSKVDYNFSESDSIVPEKAQSRGIPLSWWTEKQILSNYTTYLV
jgi:ABC-type sugar transport system substrate-binding protein